MMNSHHGGWSLRDYFAKFAISIFGLWFCGITQAAPPEAELPEKHRPLFKQHCFHCHDSETQEGKVNLQSLSFRIQTIEQAELWQKVLNAMNSGEMPPEGESQPPNTKKADLLDDLAQTMVVARRALSDSGGNITLRRLNRREYQNTIEYLTGVRVDVGSLPTDGGSGAFDTVGTSQFISSDQFEQYLNLGRIAIDEAIQYRLTKQSMSTFRVEPENTANVQSAKDLAKLEEEYERYKLWKAEVDKAALDPENEAILQQIREKYKLTDLTDNVRLYQNANLLVNTPDSTKYGFKDSNAAAFSYQGGYGRKSAYLRHYAELPHSDRGTYMKLAWGIQRIDITPPAAKLVPGTYKLRIRLGAVEGSPESRHFIEVGHPQRINGVPAGFAGFPISTHQVTGTIEHPQTIETLLEVGTHTQREFAVQEKQSLNRNVVRSEYNKAKRINGYGVDPAVWIDWMDLTGPLPETGEPSELARILIDNLAGSKESEAKRAREIISEFAVAAFRQDKPEPKFIDQLLSLFNARREAGETFEVAIRTPLSVILASPGFLYLSEPNDDTKHRTLTDRELAIRLAYFLWSSPPDAELLALAQKESLREPEVLQQQVDRLLTDPRSDEFVSGFVHQWLQMERLDFFQFDYILHAAFDESLRAAARKEVYESFAHLLRDPEGGSLGMLLKSDYVLINGLLADFYGIEGVTGDEFRQVKIPVDSPRGGLLGTAAIHAMGSDGVESSPVERGAWVLRYLLNDPPPPAPPNVPQLSRLAEQSITTRERLRVHQEEAQCASCHRKIDPIGFGLENFDAKGQWRTTDAHRTKVGKNWKTTKTWKIDASGAFYKGPSFADYFELRDRVAEREADFARGFTENLIAYALGRPFSFSDEELAQAILTKTAPANYSVSEFVHALVQSEAFRKK